MCFFFFFLIDRCAIMVSLKQAKKNFESTLKTCRCEKCSVYDFIFCLQCESFFSLVILSWVELIFLWYFFYCYFLPKYQLQNFSCGAPKSSQIFVKTLVFRYDIDEISSHAKIKMRNESKNIRYKGSEKKKKMISVLSWTFV